MALEEVEREVSWPPVLEVEEGSWLPVFAAGPKDFEWAGLT